MWETENNTYLRKPLIAKGDFFFLPAFILHLIFLQDDVKSAEPTINIHVCFFFFSLRKFEIVTVIERDADTVGKWSTFSCTVEDPKLQTPTNIFLDRVEEIIRASNCLIRAGQHLRLVAFSLLPAGGNCSAYFKPKQKRNPTRQTSHVPNPLPSEFPSFSLPSPLVVFFLIIRLWLSMITSSADHKV